MSIQESRISRFARLKLSSALRINAVRHIREFGEALFGNEAETDVSNFEFLRYDILASLPLRNRLSF